MTTVLGVWPIHVCLLVKLRIQNQDNNFFQKKLWFTQWMCINHILCHFRSRMWEMSSPDTLEILPGVPEALGHGFRMFSCFLTLSETPGHEFNSPRWMVKTPDMDIYNIAQSMSNAHTIEACRVHHFNKKIAINQYNLNGNLLSRTSTSHRMSTLARKWRLWNNSHALRIRLGIDVVFYIFKVSHNHALFRFSLSLGADTPCWALFGEEWKPKIIHTRVMGGPGIPALSRPQTAQEFLPSPDWDLDSFIYSSGSIWTLTCDNY